MARREYHILSFPLNEAGAPLPGYTETTIHKTWPAACYAFRKAVYDVTATQGLLDREAGWQAYQTAVRTTLVKPGPRDRGKRVNVVRWGVILDLVG